MKKNLKSLTIIALSLFSTALFAQDTVAVKKAEDTTKNDHWDPKNNPVVQEIRAKYENSMITEAAPLTTEAIFPVLGTYTSSEDANANRYTISLDAENKGIVWINGLPQGAVKAMLRKSPATYKIPAQKTSDGKDVNEGTLIFDQESNTLHIALGAKYDLDNPGIVFDNATVAEVPATDKKVTKTKKPAASKVVLYTATKVDNGTAAMHSNQ